MCIARLALDAKLAKYGVDCMGRLFGKVSPFQQTTPVSARYRMIRPRSTKLFSLTFCCYAISMHRSEKKTRASEWVLDARGKWKWRLEMKFFTENDEEMVSIDICVEGYDEKDKDKNIGYQVYVMNRDHDKMMVTEHDCSECELKDFKYSYERNFYWSAIEEIVDKDSDMLMFGATMYLGTCMARKE